MSELKFSGTATLTGFPRDKSFNFELDGPDRLIVKAGKEVFLVIEKEAAVVVADIAKASESVIVSGPKDVVVSIPNGTVLAGAMTPSQYADPAGPEPTGEPEAGGRKARGPNVKIDESQLIYIDLNKPNPYGKLRGKYYETLKTAIGRPVSWWKETSMVKSLEGSPLTLLKFFLSEGTVQLQAGQTTGQIQPQTNVITPSFGQGQPMQQQAVAGAAWTPQGGTPPAGRGPGSFLD